VRLLGSNLILSTSDLTKFVRCAHATYLDHGSRTGAASPVPKAPSAMTELISEKGREHEAAYIDELRGRGQKVVTIDEHPWSADGLSRGEAATLQAMKEGAPYIYQAAFFDGRTSGYADLLERVDRPSPVLGAWSYEVVDTKLARSVKAHFILQLSDYSNHVARLQGVPPESMHVVLGTPKRDRVSFRAGDFDAYYRHVRRSVEQSLARGDAATAYPVELCDLCAWRVHCWNEWKEADHLSLVANIRRAQVTRLERVGVETLTSLAEAPPTLSVPKIAEESFSILRDQARLQLKARRTGVHSWEPLQCEKDRGFARLPEPSGNDIFLDFEGDPFAGDGLTYLFGMLRNTAGNAEYLAWWAHDADGERRALEAVIDALSERCRSNPATHVYHYGATETSTLKRLAGRYATREDDLDDLLRRETFVDLSSVVRQAMRISQSSYGLKNVETFYAFDRKTRSITEGGGAVVAYERWLRTGDDVLRREIETYNREDCSSLIEMQRWLGRIKPAGMPWRDPHQPRDLSEDRLAEHQRANRLYQCLIRGESPLLAHLLYYHWREERPGWWRYFDRMKMDAKELIEDTECIGALKLAVDIPATDEKKSKVFSYRYPGQEHKFDPGDKAIDPATENAAGEIVAIDDGSRMIRIKRGPALFDKPDPKALMPTGPVSTTPLRGALERFATSIAEAGWESTPYRAAAGILLRRTPRLAGSQTLDATCVEQRLDESYLFVQGPPGSGKTYKAARLIVSLLRSGRRIGVTSNSHKAIHNLLHEIEDVARAENYWFRGLKKSGDAGSEFVSRLPNPMVENCRKNSDCADPKVALIAGTAWLLSDVLLDQSLDYLFIDEAGQVPLANALAVSTVARNVVLLGDPLQLAQVSQGSHPAGAEASVLQHLLGDDATVPPHRGVFLEHTWRMHPDVCAFVSEVVYESRLRSADECANQAVVVDGIAETGLRFMAVDHEGNTQSSDEEADRIASEIQRMLRGSFTNAAGATAPLRETDFLVVAAYNAQVRHITSALARTGLHSVPVGTVDKFQGRQAPVVFFSMATSSGTELPRDIEFLFSRNRLNVAISRTRCLAVVVASPRLLDVECKTPEQMKLVNTLCRFVEVARPL
jgi:uncharacterized protein